MGRKQHLEAGKLLNVLPDSYWCPRTSPFSLPATCQLPPKISEFRNTNRSSVAIWYVWLWASSTVAVISPDSRWIGSWGRLPRPNFFWASPANSAKLKLASASASCWKSSRHWWEKKTRLGINPCFPEMISRNITQLLRCLYHVSKSLTKSTKMYSKKSHLSESVPAEMAFPCLLTIIHPGPEPWKNHWCNSSSPESSWRQLRAKKRSKNTNETPVFPRGALQKKEKSGKADEKDEKIQCFAG